MSWTHNGVEITLTDRGTFVAQPKGMSRITGPSLDSVKKKLDGLKAAKFEPFGVIEVSWPQFRDYNDFEPEPGKLSIRRVIGISRKSGGGHEFELESKQNYYHNTAATIIPDTEANRKAVKAALDGQHAANLVKWKLTREDKERSAAIRRLSADDYIAGKTESDPEK